ncbi:hypothetical protein K437DRAFT_259026 [Tilletiaria anomala UBC 951]|uniref:Uncharacterized protein n=1 Tax=Tilletiaria anomala (strain ATCC 24038 / CBS 436.72 / UBC 951) TaxID=1037660 RepID=A0A066VLS5_TILAU|nr:uncharacterized protein K437DRAFT_259026 [Tilletiaria anomala UBC 951]KDN39535.1 hypothetical protein K437DRAFT_259026 [Tilletiaria anomala UBC 951]
MARLRELVDKASRSSSSKGHDSAADGAEDDGTPLPSSEEIVELLKHLQFLKDRLVSYRKLLHDHKDSLAASTPDGAAAKSSREAAAAGAGAVGQGKTAASAVPSKPAAPDGPTPVKLTSVQAPLKSSKPGVSKASGASSTTGPNTPVATAASSSSLQKPTMDIAPTSIATSTSGSSASKPLAAPSIPRILPRIKIKRDASATPSDFADKLPASAATANANGMSGSPGDTMDWEADCASAKLGKAYAKLKGQPMFMKRKRSRESEDEADTASETASAAGDSSMSVGPRLSLQGLKLRASPAVSALNRRAHDSPGVSSMHPQRRSSMMPQAPAAPPVYDPAWALPTVTVDSLMPKLATTQAPRPYATKPEDVHDDFATKDWRERDRERDREGGANGQSQGTKEGKKGKEQSQVPLNTFYSYADGYFKSLTEDDLAWLSSQTDDLEPFQIPPLGRYYREVFEAEDAAQTGPDGIPLVPAVVPPLSPPKASPYNTRFVPSSLTDKHLGSADDAKSGLLTERVVASLLRTTNGGLPQVPEGDEEDDAESAPSLTTTAAPTLPSMQQDTLAFEDKLKAELKMLDLFDEAAVNSGQRQDDEVSAMLRKVQEALRKQMRVNEARKARLFELARSRMSYQEYITCLNTFERDIEAGWNKRQRQIRASVQRKKKGGGGGTSSQAAAADQVSAGGAVPYGEPGAAVVGGSAGAGAGPSKPVLPDSVISAMEKRRKLIDALGPMFDRLPLSWQPPPEGESVYTDLDLEDV